TARGLDLLIAVLTEPNIPPLIRFAFGTNADAVRRISEFDVELDVVSYVGVAQPALRNRETGDLVHKFEDYAPKAFTPPKPTPSSTLSNTMSLRGEAEAIDREVAEQRRQNPAGGYVRPQRPPDRESRLPRHPSREPQATDFKASKRELSEADLAYEDRGVLSPREMRRRAREMADAETPIDSAEAARAAEENLFEGEVLTPRQMRRRIMEEEAQRAAEAGDEKSHNWLVGLVRRLFGMKS
ncbi:MAG: hypothetical protein AAF125_15310, partial [Chloroflexota bacterium]